MTLRETAPLGLFMFAAVFLVLPYGFPVAFTLIGTALTFAVIGYLFAGFDLFLVSILPLRAVGLRENDLLQAIPLFVYFGVIMQRTTLARELLEAMASLFGRRPAWCPPAEASPRVSVSKWRLALVILVPLGFLLLLLAIWLPNRQPN